MSIPKAPIHPLVTNMHSEAQPYGSKVRDDYHAYYLTEFAKLLSEHHLYERVKGKSYHSGGVSTESYESLESRDWWKALLKEGK